MAITSTLPILDPESLIGKGGFGTIFAHPEDNDKCIKVLNKPLSEAASLHLQRLIDVVRWARPATSTLLPHVLVGRLRRSATLQR